jgi:hypothetical protein
MYIFFGIRQKNSVGVRLQEPRRDSYSPMFSTSEIPPLLGIEQRDFAAQSFVNFFTLTLLAGIFFGGSFITFFKLSFVAELGIVLPRPLSGVFGE